MCAEPSKIASKSSSGEADARELLDALLKRHFGLPGFRPLQREIIEANLAGKDVLALLPTGAGKSLCFQLSAIVRPGLTVVVSPLIALMKDQVDGLSELGIKAVALNSSLNDEAAASAYRELYRGEIKILYLSPERLLLPGTLDQLKSWNVQAFAVDEAHCISHWGHDFRPEYRELSSLRDSFPELPIMALTATATPRVSEDICERLKLRKPEKFVASFNRPNLSYRIVSRHEPLKQVMEICSQHVGESGIVYCMSRARTEELAEALCAKGIESLAYHAGLESKERARRQERFINDQVSVMVATVAFGMGVDKPDVRFVIHHDLPKNIESYYQETGRAGRDGLPSECVLLYSPGDAAKIYSFLEEITDRQEQEVARVQLRKLMNFVDSSVCRRVELLRYFGEVYGISDGGEARNECGACDNCLTPRAKFDGTIEAKKLISCVLRIQNHSGFSVGLSHVVDVLVGASTEKIRKFEHGRLSTYGIGKGHTRHAWMQYGQELVQKEFLQIDSSHFNVLRVTQKGAAFLKSDETLELTTQRGGAKLEKEKLRKQRERTGATDFDGTIFDQLKALRKEIAGKKHVPAYLVFSDKTLQALARDRPQTLEAFAETYGVGERKLAEYGEVFLTLLKKFDTSSA